MDKITAEKLTSELSKQVRHITPDKELFRNFLIQTEIPESSRFYEALPNNEQIVNDANGYHYFSLRRVLRNKNAAISQLSGLKGLYGAIASAFSAYSSNTLTRDLRTDKEIVEMMFGCEEPFSLLGKIRSYEPRIGKSDDDERMFVITQPVLIIPGAKNMSPIHSWEDGNINYAEELKIFGFFPRIKKINHQEYISANKIN